MTDYKAVQTRLNALGASPPLTADGVYGPLSRAAVMAFQKSKGLAVDGIVGPATLGALGITTGAVAVTAAGTPAVKGALGSVTGVPASTDPNNIQNRAKTAAAALGLTPLESAFMRSVGQHETNLGTGWGSTPPPNGGAGSFNMGAITTNSPGPLDFQHKDSRNDTGQVIEYTTWFKGFPTFEAGIAGLRDAVLKPNVRAALAANAKNPQAAFQAGVQAMYDNHYFLGVNPRNTAAGNAKNVEDYFSAVTKAFGTISSVTGEQFAIAAGIGMGALGIVGALLYVGFRVLVKKS